MGRPRKNTSEAGKEEKIKIKAVKLPVTNVTQDDKDLATEIMDAAKMALIDFQKMDKPLKASLVTATVNDIRFSVQAYYQLQGLRIALGGQLRSIIQGKSVGTADGAKPPQTEVLQWLYNNVLGMENEIKRALDIWGNSNTVAIWAKQVCGIGPVISAGLVAYFDISKAPSVSHFYSYSGLNDNNDPWIGKDQAAKLVNRYVKGPGVTNDEIIALSQDPECPRSVAKLTRYAYDAKKDKYTKTALIKGLSKIPYNAELKTLLWKLGESFVKVSSKPESLYGRLYKERKAQEIQRNEAGMFADQAAAKLAKYNIGKGTDAYAAYINGKLPDAHIHTRSTRFAVKIFVSHLFNEMYRVHYNSEPPRPYIQVYGEHNDNIGPEVEYTPLDPNRPASAPTNPVKQY